MHIERKRAMPRRHGQSIMRVENSAHHASTGCNASRGPWYHQLSGIGGTTMCAKACLK
jgi:hypothetical protein